jgi:hypothetical protein
MRKLRFTTNIEPNALLCPNPQEFYSRCYITEEIANNYRAIPGVKSTTKVANVLFDDLLRKSECSFTDATTTLDAKEITVCPISAMAQLCRFDLETSYVALQMARGSNGSFEVASFMPYYWDEMSKQIQYEIAQIRWQGNTGGTSSTFLDLCDGYEVQFGASGSGVVPLTLGTVSVSNVISKFSDMWNLLTPACKFKKSSLRFYVSADIAALYQLAAAQGNTQTYVTLPLGLTFLGIPIVICEGMSAKKMVLTIKDNLIYAFDGEDDSKALKAVNLEDTVAEPLLRTRANFKIGFHFVNAFEIVYGS